MTSNLPEVSDASPVVFDGQAALFDDPQVVMAMSASELRLAAVDLARAVRPSMIEIRRVVGLVCWAMRAKVPAGEYGKWVEGYAEMVGVTARTLGEWRSKAEAKAGVVPAFTSPRQNKTAGQTSQLEETSKPIPADSKETPTKKSEGGEQVGKTPPAPASKPPSDASSEGAGLQPPAGPTGGTPPPQRSAPSGPNPTGPVPSLRQEASTAYRALHEATEGIGAKWTIEEATYWQNRTEREMDAWRRANRIDQPKRRQGTISRPADRAPSPPVKLNGAPSGSLTRRDVTPMFKP